MSDVDIFHAPRDFEFHDFDTRNVTASDGGTAPRNWRGIPRTGSST